ncbi:MAG: glucose-6-phosphate isomerase, partial [Gammaproteobacteria bacterium]|nr:glucose-6-phosphate isomerase [Gammaproteobacteria bacterium]
RAPKGSSYKFEGKNVVPAVHKVLKQMRGFIDQIYSGVWRGYTGKKIDTIVNIGIGGSDLGPVLTSETLQPYWQHHVKVLFVSNLDAAQLALSLSGLNPETTLFIIASKSFTTLETIYEAQSAREWFLETAHKSEHIKKHFIALSTNTEKVVEFGIDPKNMFEFWDWVGGRYSIWSCIGLSAALAIGMDNFESMLAGAHDMDEHFFNAEESENMPLIHALISIWHRNFCGYSSKAVLPYDSLLYQLPSYLQQLEMESNGKSVKRNGEETEYKTCPVIWGGSGSNGQHAFFQFLHQGTDTVPIDFIASVKNHYQIREHQTLLFSNLLAQAEALMNGRDLSPQNADDHTQNVLNNNRSFKGSIPSNTILIKQLTPYNMGALLAFYEHSIFVQGTIWDINSFDQWGVELGKELANQLSLELLNGITDHEHDSSTAGLMAHYLKISEKDYKA